MPHLTPRRRIEFGGLRTKGFSAHVCTSSNRHRKATQLAGLFPAKGYELNAPGDLTSAVKIDGMEHQTEATSSSSLTAPVD